MLAACMGQHVSRFAQTFTALSVIGLSAPCASVNMWGNFDVRWAHHLPAKSDHLRMLIIVSDVS